MSIQQFKPILFADEAVSKTPFSKKGKQSLYFTTSLTTLLLLQACAGSGNGDLDGRTQGDNQNGDDQNGDSTTPEEVQPPSPSEIIKVLPTEAREDYNGAAYSEVIYNARMSGNFDTQAGNDVLVLWRPGAEGDEASGGSGNDVIESVNSTRAVHGNEGNDVIRSFFNEKIYGDNGNDDLYGGDGGNTLYGNNGNDDLYGDDGADKIFGGAGNDFLSGGLQLDEQTGGDGADIFSFYQFEVDPVNGGTYDRILDFELGIDRILVHADFGDIRDAVSIAASGANTKLRYVDDDSQDYVTIAFLKDIKITDITDWEAETGMDFIDEVIIASEFA